jgi:hypothetical protein
LGDYVQTIQTLFLDFSVTLFEELWDDNETEVDLILLYGVFDLQVVRIQDPMFFRLPSSVDIAIKLDIQIFRGALKHLQEALCIRILRGEDPAVDFILVLIYRISIELEIGLSSTLHKFVRP